MNKDKDSYYWAHIKLDDNSSDTYWGECTNDVVNGNVTSAEDIEFSFEFCCYKWRAAIVVKSGKGN